MAPNGTLKAWNAKTGRVWRTLTGHGTGRVTHVALSTDGKTAFFGLGDKTLTLWDVQAGQARWTVQAHAHLVNAVALSADGKTAISGSEDRTVKVWDVETGRERWTGTLRGFGCEVSAVALSADGNTVIAGTMGGALTVWEVKTGPEQHWLRGHDNWLASVALSADGKTAISASADKTLRVWNLETKRCLLSFTSEAGFTAVALARTMRVFAGDEAGNVHLLDLRLGPDQAREPRS